jgi:outer membrane protein insertion porin family
LSISHDSRDNLFDPRQGIFVEWTNELAGTVFNGNNNFVRSRFVSKYFDEINQKTVIASAFEIGWIGRLGNYEEIPLSERFYTGGTNSIRGFKYQMVGPLDQEDNPIGGKFKIVWNIIELRRSLYKILGGVLFIDAGNVWSNKDDFNFSGIRISSGLGLRLSSPIGILRLDYGINMDNHKNESKSVLHFNMGHSF